MTLISALEDLQETTLRAITGCLRKLEYVAGLRSSAGPTLTGDWFGFTGKGRRRKLWRKPIVRCFQKCCPLRCAISKKTRGDPVSWRDFRRRLIWNSFSAGVPDSCHRARERDRHAILVQCFMRFRVCCRIKHRAPFPQLDGHAHHLTDDFRLLGVA